VSVLLASVAHGAETAGQLIDDSTVATKTKAALLDKKADVGASINVEVYKGVVQLSGFVESHAAETTALTTAGKVEGARKVLDAIVVIEGSRTMGETVDDTTIQAKLKSGLAKVEGLGEAVAINTEVRHGHVLLAGFVAGHSVAKAAGDVAKGISGVKEVHNFITVEP
jgi:hyperosmotically inducible protein